MKKVAFETIQDDYIDYITRVSVDMVYLSISSCHYIHDNEYRLMYHDVDHDYSAIIYGNLEHLIKRLHHLMMNLQD